jgi:SAM-dependent methyltransferase
MPDPECFDLIIAEGFLNVVGFEKGFRQVNGLLRKGGFFVIHDEVRDQETKTELIRECNCQLIYSRLLDENVWWDDYYRQLEAEINSPSNTNIGGLFKNDLEEIAYYRINPAAFRSVYYVVQKL